MKFSNTTKCFYPEDIAYPNLPEDLIDVTPAQYAEASARGSNDALDVIDGQLVVVPAPSLTVAESLASAKSAKASELSAACAKAIVNGFTSSALGSAHIYPSDQNDQANLNANVVSSLLPNLPTNWTTPQLCCDSAGVWTYRAHSMSQIQQVGVDGKAAVLLQLAHHVDRRAALQAVTTVEAVNAIVWEA